MQRSVYILGAVLLLGILLVVGTSVAVEPSSPVERSSTAEITISITDSSNGADTATTQVDIQSDTQSSVPSDLQRFTGGDGTIDNIDVLSAVQAANSGTQISGQPVENLDVLSLVQYANSS